MEGHPCASPEAEITAVWAHINAATCAQWLNRQRGIGPVAAREKLRVAHALEDLPKISSAFGTGELSYSKVRALTRVAQRAEDASEAWAIHEARTANYWFDDDGSFVLHARLTPQVGAVVRKALELATASAGKDDSAETFPDQLSLSGQIQPAAFR